MACPWFTPRYTLDIAVAVAAGIPCLRRFDADETGPVLMFPAEDAGHIVRARLQSIASAAGARFEALDIAVIDVPALRLDHRADRQRLVETVERTRPRLLVLDPLVRLYGVDENTVAEVAPMGLTSPIPLRCCDRDNTLALAFDISLLGGLAFTAGTESRNLMYPALEQMTQTLTATIMICSGR